MYFKIFFIKPNNFYSNIFYSSLKKKCKNCLFLYVYIIDINIKVVRRNKYTLEIH